MLFRAFVRHRALLPYCRANETTVIPHQSTVTLFQRDLFSHGSLNGRTVSARSKVSLALVDSISMPSTLPLSPSTSPLLTPTTSPLEPSLCCAESRRCFTRSTHPYGAESPQAPADLRLPSLTSLAADADAGDPEEIEMEKVSVTYRYEHAIIIISSISLQPLP